MTDVLHLQTRVYPLDHSGLAAPDEVQLSDGTRLRRGRLGSLSYRVQHTLEVDEPTFLDRVPVPDGMRVAWRHVRVLATGAMFVVVALEHDRDLTALSLHELTDLDAAIDRMVRPAELAAMAAFRTRLVRSGALQGRPSEESRTSSGGVASGLEDPVRFDCHLVAEQRIWDQSARVTTNGLLEDTGCEVLLPYTYAWSLSPSASRDELLTAIEPADLATAQRVVLGAAQGRAVRVLDRLAEDRDRPAPLDRYRAELDRVRAIYQRLDAYRYDSSQRARAVYLAARAEMGLDDLHARTEVLLGQVAESLSAATDARSMRFDRLLNRTVGAVAIVTAGVFVLDLIGFARAGEPLGLTGRVVVLVLILSAAAMGLWAVFGNGRSRVVGRRG